MYKKCELWLKLSQFKFKTEKYNFPLQLSLDSLTILK